MKEVIYLSQVKKRYKRSFALKGVSLSVKEGELFGIIGPDGSGKSTLMKIISGVLKPDSGEVYVLGKDVVADPDAVKNDISFMPQGIGQNLYMDLTVSENIDFFAQLKGIEGEKALTLKKTLLDITGLSPFENRLAKNLSGGMQQKLGLCCCLISRPKVLILDEPTTGVDPVSRRELWDLLYEFVESGVTILISTSYMLEAERCHRIALMHEGKVVEIAEVEDILNKYKNVEELFKTHITVPDKNRICFTLPDISRKSGNSIVVKNLTKKFGDFVAVDNISFSVNEGEIFGLLGPNGAGKTTTIKMLVGLLKPTSGEIRVPPKKELGYMSQRFSLYKDLTVSENIDYYAALYSIPFGKRAGVKEWIISLSGLDEYRNEMTERLPLGMRQRLALGCSFIHMPSLLFLDEPTSGVDPAGRELFWKIIRDFSRKLNVTVIVTTHHLIEAHYCDRLALMNAGRIVALGSPCELVERALSIQGDIFEIRGDALKNIKDFLTSKGIYVYYYGKSLRVWDRISLNELKDLLFSFNVEITLSNVNMEDVFVLFSKEKTALVGNNS